MRDVDARLEIKDEMEFECVLKDKDGDVIARVSSSNMDELIAKLYKLEHAQEEYIDAELEPDYDDAAKYADMEA